MKLFILVLLAQSLVYAKFNRRAALTKFHKNASDAITTPNDANDEQPAADSAEEQASAHGLLGQKITWKRIRAAAIKRRKLDLIGQSNADDSKYQALLQKLLNEENKRRQVKKSLHYAFYSMNLI